MIIKVTPKSFHVSQVCFCGNESQHHLSADSIIDKNYQCAFGPPALKSVMRRAINLDQFTVGWTSHAALIYSGMFTTAFTPYSLLYHLLYENFHK